MNQILSALPDYLYSVMITSFRELLLLFGPLILFSVSLHFSALYLARFSMLLWGRNLFLYAFGWFGCAVHELSHALFALLFGHKVVAIELFNPKGKNEAMGFVKHTYNKKSVYQKAGNFFIGISPLLAGGLVLLGSVYFLYGTVLTHRFDGIRFPEIVLSWNQFLSFVLQIGEVVHRTFRLLFFEFSGPMWKALLLCFLLYSTGSSMILSWEDIGTARRGFLLIVVLILLATLATYWKGTWVLDGSLWLTGFLAGFYLVLLLTLLSNLLFLSFMLILYGVKSLIWR